MNQGSAYYPPSNNNNPWGVKDERPVSNNRPGYNATPSEFYDNDIDERLPVYRQPPQYTKTAPVEVDDINIQPVY